MKRVAQPSRLREGKGMRQAFGVRPACRRFGTCEKREQARRTPNAAATISLFSGTWLEP